MNMRLSLLLLCLAAVATATSDMDMGRHLLQSPNQTDCARSVTNCNECRYQFYRGTITKAICTKCDAGYIVKQSGRACWCAPGYYLTNDAANTCSACGQNAYCVGAKATKASGAAHIDCGANKMTTSEYARSAIECLAQPGYGWAAGDAVACQVGFYNPGRNNRKCTRCPGGLTTNDTNAQSTQYCVAPIGFYYLRGRSVACARGTWKGAIGNTDCTECPEGFTTVAGETGKTAAADCSVVLPGYSAPGTGVTLGTTAATMCPEGSYRVGDAPYTAGSAVTCDACPNGMSTLPNTTAATSPDACLVKPGYGWNAGTSPGNATECPIGSFNPGWNREACTDCGLGGITTDAVQSTSADDCKTPAGYGTNRTANGLTLFAYECPANTYGRASDTYGLVDVECTKCPDHTSTAGTGSTGGSACLTDAGYGWYDGQVLQCEYATYNPGGNQNPCTECAQGYNTTNPGSTLANQCLIAAGWIPDGSTGIEPCLRGYYKNWLGDDPDVCTKCPAGTTTTITLASTARTDCDACRPGFGNAAIDLTNPACTICASGYYSAGFVKNGADCVICPNPYNFTGTMVSRRGISTPEDCVGMFPTDAAAGLENDQDWDVIWMNESLTVQTGDLAACQAGCKNSNKCQYFEWRDWLAPDSQCYYKLGSADLATPDLTNIAASFVLFEVKAGQYASYIHDQGGDVHFIGETLDETRTTLQDAVDACDAQAACIGITKKAGVATWRLFKGTKFQDAVGKVRVFGPAINPWISEPTAS